MSPTLPFESLHEALTWATSVIMNLGGYDIGSPVHLRLGQARLLLNQAADEGDADYLGEIGKWLKPGQTTLQRFEQDQADLLALTRLLAQERRLVEELKARPVTVISHDPVLLDLTPKRSETIGEYCSSGRGLPAELVSTARKGIAEAEDMLQNPPWSKEDPSSRGPGAIGLGGKDPFAGVFERINAPPPTPSNVTPFPMRGVETPEERQAAMLLGQKIADAVNHAKAAGVPQGIIAALFHAEAHRQTHEIACE